MKPVAVERAEHEKQKLQAEVIEHTRHNHQTNSSQDLITVVITNYKPIDAEIEKHRMVSSNSSSDRAIPFWKILQREPFLPPDVRKNERGMQGYENLSDSELVDFYDDLEEIYRFTTETLAKWKDKVHKQHLNRYLLPFALQNKILTANKDQWDYFLYVRNRHDVDPNMRIIAEKIQEAIDSSEPRHVDFYSKFPHIPFIREEERKDDDIEKLVLKSVARCARVSYENHDKKIPTEEEDLDLAYMLVERDYYSERKQIQIDEDDPIHATPTEHQGSPATPDTRSGNFHSWHQFRKIVENIDSLSNLEV